ncbi:hypothetical protein Zmor_022955 [Zophobas morio]|uniref:Cytochrome P450 n=1 Tax=Zophobas morio TaxID=2755281 RepID=A0AA38HXZ3_9CUCU|nr:hypothetical protein Zmor_022955 [Zophobas morio]
MWWVAIAIAAALVGYWLLVRPHSYWVDKGVEQGPPRFSVWLNWQTIIRKLAIAEMVEVVYNTCPKTRYSGFYLFLQPILVLKDLDLIKQIYVKDFDHFLDRRTLIPEDNDPLWDKNLFALTGEKWREMRATLSPAFTRTKMKYMFTLIWQNGEQFTQYFLNQKRNLVTVEMKDIFTRLTSDVIANTVFGVECDSLRDRKNEFYLMAKEATDFGSFRKKFILAGYLLIPKLFKIFKITMFSKSFGKFFTNLVTTNIRSREKLGIVRPDVIQVLLEARAFLQDAKPEMHKNNKTEITDQDIVSQALVFLFAGFETVSTLMCFMSYELALNPDVQTRLIQEVDETVEACKGKLTYESLLGMKYMDMVVSETLRKWPNLVALDRVCTRPYTIEAKYPDERPIHLEKGAVVWLPVFGLHRDPEFFPEPDRFDPERFGDENKAKIKPYTYVPFGAGPRNCIGYRFALLETKILFFNILSHFEIVPVEKTQVPLVLSKKHFSLIAEKGFWLGLRRREN